MTDTEILQQILDVQKDIKKMLRDSIIINLLTNQEAKKEDIRKFIAEAYGSCDNNYLTKIYQLARAKKGKKDE